MEGLFDNLEGRSDSQNFEPLTSTLRTHTQDFIALFYPLVYVTYINSGMTYFEKTEPMYNVPETRSNIVKFERS